MAVPGRAVLQKGHGTRQLAGSGLQAELGTAVGAGAVLQAEESVAGLLQDSHLMTELVPWLWLVGPGAGATIYSVFVPLNLLKKKQKQKDRVISLTLGRKCAVRRL